MAMTGFDPQLVQNSISKVDSAYAELVQALYNEMQTNFVDTMSNYWACTDAQVFFRDKFKPAIDGLLNGSFSCFQSVINSMNSAAQGWATQTDSAYSPKSFSGQLKTIDISIVRENINGVRGVDESMANGTADRLSTVAQHAETALTTAVNAVQNCGFVGRNMEQQLVGALNTIKNNINNASIQLTTSTKSAINQTVSSYGTFASNVETAFTAE